jgi:hypothetical protein
VLWVRVRLYDTKEFNRGLLVYNDVYSRKIEFLNLFHLSGIFSGGGLQPVFNYLLPIPEFGMITRILIERSPQEPW